MFQGFSVINLASILVNIRDTKGKASRSEVCGFCGIHTEIYRRGGGTAGSLRAQLVRHGAARNPLDADVIGFFLHLR